MTRILQRAKHLFQRIENECKAFPQIKRTYGFNVASATFKDGLVPPGKSEKYISTIQEYVDKELSSVIKLYNTNPPKHNYRPKPNANINDDKMPIWCCWWQGVESMPEIVKMCHTRLKQVIPKDKTELHIITFDNYKDYVDIPEHILEKFNKGIVTMTTMSDVLRFCLLERYGMSASEIRPMVLAALKQVGLKDKTRSFPHQLSGGEQQRVCIARAIVNKPKLLLCDEPTGNLDPETSKEIMDVIENINKELGTTVVMATHDKEIVNRMKKRVVVVSNGLIEGDYLKGSYKVNESN